MEVDLRGITEPLTSNVKVLIAFMEDLFSIERKIAKDGFHYPQLFRVSSLKAFKATIDVSRKYPNLDVTVIRRDEIDAARLLSACPNLAYFFPLRGCFLCPSQTVASFTSCVQLVFSRRMFAKFLDLFNQTTFLAYSHVWHQSHISPF